MSEICDDTTIALSIKNLNRYLQGRAHGTSRNRALSDLDVAKEGVTQLQTLVCRLAGEVAEMGEQLATARQIATVLMKNLEDVTAKVGGVVKISSTHPTEAIPSVTPWEQCNACLGTGQVPPAYRGGVMNLKTGEVKEGAPLANVVESMKEDFLARNLVRGIRPELLEAAKDRKMGEPDPNEDYSLMEKVSSIRMTELPAEGEAFPLNPEDYTENGESWRIVNDIFRNDRKAYQKLCARAFKAGLDTTQVNLMKVVKKCGDPRKW